MKRLEIDLSDCESLGEFYDALLAALKAPGWHGRNLDALWDSITSDINEVMPPYSIELVVGDSLPTDVATEVCRVKALFDEARESANIEVAFDVK